MSNNLPSQASVDYMTDTIMPLNREAGCTCPYTPKEYATGRWMHQSNCPHPSIECLPNAGRLYEALRAGKGRA